MTSSDSTEDLWREAGRKADVAHSRLVELGRTVAVAESLTGGLISALLTSAPGTSATFRGGLVVYSTELKHDLAGVDQALLEAQGPVHSDVAAQLALGARARLGADYGIGATGVAGPGGQGGRPVGEVFVAVAEPWENRSGDGVLGDEGLGDAEQAVSVARHDFGGTRDEIRLQTVITALSDLTDILDAAAGYRPSTTSRHDQEVTRT